jgi:hypothetical protein
MENETKIMEQILKIAVSLFSKYIKQISSFAAECALRIRGL